MQSYPLSDIELSRRLERAEAAANANFVEARAQIAPESGAAWIDLGGTYAMFDGPNSPCTQTFGLGLFEPVAPKRMQQIEAFYRERNAPVFHEVSPMVDPTLLNLLCERGYSPVELSSTMYQPLAGRMPLDGGAVTARVIGPEEHDTWTRVATEGWAEFTEVADMLHDLMQVTAARTRGQSFLAELDGEPVAAGGLFVHEAVALLAGSSTIPRFRRRGAQKALLEARLRYAEQMGADIAVINTAPGSASQRNSERQGFRIAYTRMKWKLIR